MRFDLIVAVWGSWHIDMMSRAMLPSLMAEGNLPALTQGHDVRLRIFTRAADRAVIAALPAYRRVAAMVPTELADVTAAQDIAAAEHLSWWDRGVREAAKIGACIFNLPPDVVWSDGALCGALKALTEGFRMVLAPASLRVVSETVVPELERRFGSPDGGPMAVSIESMADAALRHLHPLSALYVEGATMGRPGFHQAWSVPGEGLLLRSAREILAMDAQARGVNRTYFLDDFSDLKEVYTPNGADGVFFLSLAPLAKDFGLFVEGEPLRPLDVALWLHHPDNGSAAGLPVTKINTRLTTGPMTEARWRRVEAHADASFAQIERYVDAFRIREALHALGCRRSAAVLALALRCGVIAKAVRRRRPTVILAPTDEALNAYPQDRLREALAPGGEEELVRLLRRHIVAGDGMTTLAGETLTLSQADDDGTCRVGPVRSVGRRRIGDMTVLAVDGVFGEPAAPEGGDL